MVPPGDSLPLGSDSLLQHPRGVHGLDSLIAAPNSDRDVKFCSEGVKRGKELPAMVCFVSLLLHGPSQHLVVLCPSPMSREGSTA